MGAGGEHSGDAERHGGGREGREGEGVEERWDGREKAGGRKTSLTGRGGGGGFKGCFVLLLEDEREKKVEGGFCSRNLSSKTWVSTESN